MQTEQLFLQEKAYKEREAWTWSCNVTWFREEKVGEAGPVAVFLNAKVQLPWQMMDTTSKIGTLIPKGPCVIIT